MDFYRPAARSMLIRLLAERIVAEWLDETAALEAVPDRPHNVTHDQITSPLAARGFLQPVQL